MNNFHIVTVATESKYYFPYLLESCKNNGKELEVLGYGEKWEGLNWKFKKMVDYLKSLPEKDIVCFVDGYDVICCRDLSEITKVFLDIKEKTGCKMIIGEDKFYNFLKLPARYFMGECKGNNINSGTYIGYAKDLLEIITKIHELDPRPNANDQRITTKYCNMNDDIHCDVDSELFLTLCYPLTELDRFVKIDKNRVLYYKHNTPFFVHGNANAYLDNIIKNLGYNIEDDKIKNELSNTFLKKLFYNDFLPLIRDNFLIILLIIIVIIILINYKTFSLYSKKLSRILSKKK